MVAAIPFLSITDIESGVAMEVLQKYEFNPYSQYYDKMVQFKESTLIYFNDTWIK